MERLRPVDSVIVNGRETPPRIQSILFWKDAFSGKVSELEWLHRAFKPNGFDYFDSGHGLFEFKNAQRILWPSNTTTCNLCRGLKSRHDHRGYVYCVCYLLADRLDTKALLTIDNSSIESTVVRANMNQLEIHGGNTTQRKSIEKAICSVKAWITRPEKWMVISGPTGTGKTHMLASIYSVWHKWAAYIVASDFETRLRQGLETNTVNRVITALKLIPILLIDDLGIEHQTPWILQKLDDLFEYRSRQNHWFDRLTVVTTNIPMTGIRERFSRDGISRIGSRLTDRQMITWIGIATTDYRLRQR